MNEIFINLKRFDVPTGVGGICPIDNPGKWIEWVIEQSVQFGLGKMDDVRVTYLLPEALILQAATKLATYPDSDRTNIQIGCQGVYREDIQAGGNFGAFTTNLPAAAAANLGCTWSIIAHSEERKDKFDILARLDPAANENDQARKRANDTLNTIINEEVICALKQNLNVLLCVGETAEERGDGEFEQQKPRIEAVLKDQLMLGLKGVDSIEERADIVIGYEPRWAIGPGKTPPGGEYIGFVSAYIKSVVQQNYGFDPVVVYGGGLKEENAAMIASIDTIGGGLVALTKFTPPIAFEPEGLKTIIDTYLA